MNWTWVSSRLDWILACSISSEDLPSVNCLSSIERSTTVFLFWSSSTLVLSSSASAACVFFTSSWYLSLIAFNSRGVLACSTVKADSVTCFSALESASSCWVDVNSVWSDSLNVLKWSKLLLKWSNSSRWFSIADCKSARTVSSSALKFSFSSKIFFNSSCTFSTWCNKRSFSCCANADNFWLSASLASASAVLYCSDSMFCSASDATLLAATRDSLTAANSRRPWRKACSNLATVRDAFSLSLAADASIFWRASEASDSATISASFTEASFIRSSRKACSNSETAKSAFSFSLAADASIFW